ncbi:uncharacterized protein LODBEIA_P25790 [Lodderomyces beijingensis]|uniref:Uncharacterized protein n=1 Tax=Lodderomyces beijingensis TaxID=1775926 RepID=A0ABP0ZQ75_9ASCO
MELFHLHVHLGYNWMPHFEINGMDSLEKQIEAKNIVKMKRKKNGTEYLKFKDCKTCQGKQIASCLRK